MTTSSNSSNQSAHAAHGYHTASPYLIVKDAAKALEFYQNAFGAKELMRMAMPDGKIVFAEIQIGNSLVLLTDEYPELGAHSPLQFGGSPMRIHLYVDDVDSFANRAVAAGATLVRPLQNQFFGDRSGGLEDPFGHRWSIATRVENVSREEMLSRLQEMLEAVPTT